MTASVNAATITMGKLIISTVSLNCCLDRKALCLQPSCFSCDNRSKHIDRCCQLSFTLNVNYKRPETLATVDRLRSSSDSTCSSYRQRVGTCTTWSIQSRYASRALVQFTTLVRLTHELYCRKMGRRSQVCTRFVGVNIIVSCRLMKCMLFIVGYGPFVSFPHCCAVRKHHLPRRYTDLRIY